MLASYINCQIMSSKILKQKDFSSVASNESQLTLVSLVSDEHEEDGEGAPLPKAGEPVQASPSQSKPLQPVTAVLRLLQQRTYMPVYISTSTCMVYHLLVF